MSPHPYLNQWYQFCPHCQEKLLAREKNFTVCPKCDFAFYNNPAPAVAVLLINNQQQLLLAKRKNPPRQNYWDNPGGFVDVGESAEKTVIREMEEETSLKVKIIKYLGSVPDTYGLGPTLNLVYLVEKLSGQLKAHDDVVELKWFTIDQIPWDEIAFQNTQQAVKMYQQYKTKHKEL